MGRNLPSDRGDAIDWLTDHVGLWTDNAALIGADPADVAAVAALTSAAANARAAAGVTRTASKNATQNYYDKADEAMDGARDLILQIKAFAASTDDPQVYVLAGLSPKASPGETPPPDAPSDVVYFLKPSGKIELRWKGRGPQGTFYVITRQLPGENRFIIIATVTDKSYTDNSVPYGTDQVLYQIIAQQTDKTTEGPITLVRMGVGNGAQGEQVA
ncbi:MAG: hypothetical protein ACIAS6_04700 [Phycisphaerales bacterium JB060]